MNQIKFRGKNNHGEWHFGGISADKKFIVAQFTFQNVRPDTVGQFTGFYDKKGVEIYEDDVVEINRVPYIVKWRSRNGAFILENDKVLQSMLNTDDCKVIGNVHDDPKLFQNLQKEFSKQNREMEF